MSDLEARYRQLLLTIIQTASEDLGQTWSQRQRWTSAQYFLGPVYQEHLAYLSLESDELPKGVTENQLNQILEEGLSNG